MTEGRSAARAEPTETASKEAPISFALIRKLSFEERLILAARRRRSSTREAHSSCDQRHRCARHRERRARPGVALDRLRWRISALGMSMLTETGPSGELCCIEFRHASTWPPTPARRNEVPTSRCPRVPPSVDAIEDCACAMRRSPDAITHEIDVGGPRPSANGAENRIGKPPSRVRADDGPRNTAAGTRRRGRWLPASAWAR